MPGPVYQNLVKLELLEAVKADYLVRFLRPYEDYCRSRDVLLDDVTINQEWIEHLYSVLTAFDPEMPSELQQALVDIGDLVGEAGHEQIVAAAKERQLDLFKRAEQVSTAELAFRTYLDHRDLFDVSHARVQSSEASSFVEFFASDDRPFKGYMTKAKKILLTKQIGTWCDGRNRSSFCQVIVTEAGDEVSFLLIHGKPPTSHGVISKEARGRLSYIREKQDMVVFDKAKGKLAINAQYPVEQDFYRRVFGQVFFGDEDHFAAAPVYTGAPLIDEGADALSARGIPGLKKASLRELRVTYANRRRRRLRMTDDDLAPLVDSPVGEELLKGAEVRYLKLALEVDTRRRPLLVEITPPNKLEHDRRVASNTVSEFLLARGFMRLPGSEKTG